MASCSAAGHVQLHIVVQDALLHPEVACLKSGGAFVDAGTTSQPCMGAIVHSLARTPLDTGLDPASLSALSSFWEHTRALYAPFESDMKSCSTDVYQHEMPGGQYTNLKFQVSFCMLCLYMINAAPFGSHEPSPLLHATFHAIWLMEKRLWCAAHAMRQSYCAAEQPCSFDDLLFTLARQIVLCIVSCGTSSLLLLPGGQIFPDRICVYHRLLLVWR